MPTLPAALAYLQPFLNYIDGLPPDDVHADADLTLLFECVRGRIDGLSLDAARDRLEADQARLTSWCAQLDDREASPLFLEALLCPEMAEHVIRESRARAAAAIVFDPPHGFVIRHDGHGVALERAGTHVLIAPATPADLQAVEHAGEAADAPYAESADVDFGPVTGRKHVVVRPTRKSIAYGLHVPGGQVIVRVSCQAVDYDESALEHQLHTLELTAPA